MMAVPLAAKWRVLRVMTWRPCRGAVAAINPSLTGIGTPADCAPAGQLAPPPRDLGVNRQDQFAKALLEPHQPR